MNFGAKDANSKEAIGIIVFVVGLVLLTAGWSYGTGIIQPLLMLIGIVGFVAGFVVLRAAKAGG